MIALLAIAVTVATAPPSPTPAPRPIVERVLRLAAHDTGVRLGLLRAVAVHESAMQSNALSKAGAVGVMQTLPEVAHEHGCFSIHDVRCEIYAGARYLAKLLNFYHGNVRLSLAAYNAGPGAVRRFHGVPPYAETRAYVQSILADITIGEHR